MATLTLPIARPLFQNAQEYFADLVASYNQYRAYMETLNELLELSDREIADLGLDHKTAHTLAYEAVYGSK